MVMLLICPVRPGDSNEELRYAMRSWESHLLFPDGLTLMTVGYLPTWMSPDIHVEGNLYRSVPLAVFDNVMLGSERAADEWDECLFMNDDFFCLDPMDSVLPVRRNCTLAEHIAKFPVNSNLWWPTSLRLTASWLAEQGFPHPDSYEVHRPLPASPAAMFDVLSRWTGGMEGPIPQWRTMYGNVMKVDAVPVKDAKLGRNQPGVGSPWVSTSDQSWRLYSKSLIARFQKPSRWER